MKHSLFAVVLVNTLSIGFAAAAEPHVAESMMAAPEAYATRILRQIGEANTYLQASQAVLQEARDRLQDAEARHTATQSKKDLDALERSRADEMTSREKYVAARLQFDAINAIERDIAEGSQWRFHRRTHGVLVAVPVARNLNAKEKYDGEAAIVNITHRLIQQDDLSGRIEVVFIEPAALQCPVRGPQIVTCRAGHPPAACGCR